jgi:hypothetical protein
MKTINVTFSDVDFAYLIRAKEIAGLSWEQYILLATEKYLDTLTGEE